MSNDNQNIITLDLTNEYETLSVLVGNEYLTNQAHLNETTVKAFDNIITILSIIAKGCLEQGQSEELAKVGLQLINERYEVEIDRVIDSNAMLEEIFKQSQIQGDAE